MKCPKCSDGVLFEGNKTEDSVEMKCHCSYSIWIMRNHQAEKEWDEKFSQTIDDRNSSKHN